MPGEGAVVSSGLQRGAEALEHLDLGPEFTRKLYGNANPQTTVCGCPWTTNFRPKNIMFKIALHSLK